MTNWVPVSIWALDAGVLAMTTWLGVCCLGYRGRLEVALGWGLLALMEIVGAGIVLGMLGALGHSASTILLHTVILAGGVLLRRSHLREDARRFAAFLRETAAIVRVPGWEGVLAAALLLVSVSFLVLAGFSEPVVFDALTYRLSRVGHWLQEGTIGVITTDDARLNYMPVAPDLVMAWMIASRVEGFQAAAVAQALGGLLALGATMGLARLTGLSRAASLAGALVLCGVPNVIPQFTSAYTDLFTAGVLSAAFYLWLVALRRGEGSWLGGAGMGLALAAKGTVVYFAPGLLPVVIWLAMRHRAGVRAWVRTALGGMLAVALFVAPSLVRNRQAYGGWTGPADFVTWHHGVTPGILGSAEKLGLNLASAFAQLCEPNSQPPWWRVPVRSVGEKVIAHLPEQDPYAFDDLNRRMNLRKIYAVAAPDADVASTGVLLPTLGLLAGLTALLGRRGVGRELALAWAVAITGFVLFMNWRVQWNPYQFRFLVLGAPWLAVLVVWWIAQMPRGPRIAIWTVVAATSAHGFWAGMVDTYQSGWPALTHPRQSFGYHVYHHWRSWTAELDQPDAALRPALPMNTPLAAFYRQQPLRRVKPARLATLAAASAEEAVSAGGEWILVPAAHFLGREGNVVGRTWLNDGDARNAFSLAAYRALRDGEQPVPLIYRDQLVEAPLSRRQELLVRTWGPSPVRWHVTNGGDAICRFVLRTPAGTFENEVGPRASVEIETGLPANTLSPVVLEYAVSSAARAPRPHLEIRLLP